MTQINRSYLLVAVMAAIYATGVADPVHAQMVRTADIDFEGSGFVTPAGMVDPSAYPGGIMQVGGQSAYAGGYANSPMYMYGDSAVSQVGYCDSTGGCDGGYGMAGGCYGGYGSGCGCGGACGCNQGSCFGRMFQGGLIGKMCADDGTCCLRHLCLFCRGDGCSACQGWMHVGSMVHCLLPYSEAGLCAQRWYDLSAEVVWLGHSSGGQSGVLTTDGIAGTPVLDLSSADAGDSLDAGIRLSGSFVCGVSSNMELTYMGGQEWSDLAVAQPNPVGTPTLYSFISDFGTNPNNGFDDTDRSLVQSLEQRSDFHSGEWNWRHRNMGACCRFQGSWLLGLRYVRFDNRMIYATRGENDNTVNADLPRFFSSNDKIKNNLFGPQAGFDLWWNVHPGINLGFGLKGAWVQNDAKRQTILTGNSLDPLATPGTIELRDTRRNGTYLVDFETTLIYRLSHSWSLRTSYYALAADEVGYATVDGDVARAFVTASPISEPDFVRNSLVVQGISFGTEYMW